MWMCGDKLLVMVGEKKRVRCGEKAKNGEDISMFLTKSHPPRNRVLVRRVMYCNQYDGMIRVRSGTAAAVVVYDCCSPYQVRGI